MLLDAGHALVLATGGETVTGAPDMAPEMYLEAEDGQAGDWGSYGLATTLAGYPFSGSMPFQAGTVTCRWPLVPLRMILRSDTSLLVLVSRRTCSGLAMISM